MKRFPAVVLIGLMASTIGLVRAEERSVREIVAAAAAASTPAAQREIILTLKLKPSPEAVTWLEKWKEGGIFLHTDDAGLVTPVVLTGNAAGDGSFATLRVSDNSPLLAADNSAIRINPKEVEFADTDSGLRRAMKEVSDLAALADPDTVKRIRAIQDSAIGQKQEKLPALLLLKTTEKDKDAIRALEEAIAIIQLRSPVAGERVAACKKLGALHSIAASDTIKTILTEAVAAKDAANCLRVCLFDRSNV